MIGRIIGTYKIQSKIGEGGMGAVYQGIDTMLDREVAIKALKPELTSQTSIVERFRAEAITLAKLNHPNIATLYSLLRDGDDLFMVLEYVRGESLDEILSRRGALPTSEVVPVFCQILDGINHAHQLGIIHRDIKPANMMLTENGTLKVLDFGIARLLGTSRMTRAGNIIGTLEYMAPEQVRGLETDARSDIYALGMLLYEMLTGRAPFDTDNEFELMKLQTEVMPARPSSINASIPDDVEAAIFRAVQKDPDQRYQTAGEFRRALLSAGFTERGAIRRSTDPERQPATRIASPPPTPAETHLPDTGEIKGTRFVPDAAVSYPIAESPETRLGSPLPNVAASTAAPTSFLSRLTWVHYAGVVSVLLFGLLFILVGSIVIFSRGPSAAANVANGRKPSANTTPAPAAQTPAPISRDEAPPSTPSQHEASPISVEPVETPSSPSRSATTDEPKQAPRREAPPPTTAKRAAPAPAKPRDTNLRRARCALTGDC